MCQFISWVEKDGKNYYLTNKHLKDKQGRILLTSDYKDDIKGHGAIAHYYNQDYNFGVHRECTDFSTPKNFPIEIAKDFINGNMSMIGISTDVLNEAGMKEYEKVQQSALVKIVKQKNTESRHGRIFKMKKLTQEQYGY